MLTLQGPGSKLVLFGKLPLYRVLFAFIGYYCHFIGYY